MKKQATREQAIIDAVKVLKPIAKKKNDGWKSTTEKVAYYANDDDSFSLCATDSYRLLIVGEKPKDAKHPAALFDPSNPEETVYRGIPEEQNEAFPDCSRYFDRTENDLEVGFDVTFLKEMFTAIEKIAGKNTKVVLQFNGCKSPVIISPADKMTNTPFAGLIMPVRL